jgi:ribulose-5-phosphate 4-epimerase/fuculose-1-phosphate aldolase
MTRHGALIVGADMDETFRRAKRLEDVCRSVCRGQPCGTEEDTAALAELAERVKEAFSHVAYTAAPAVRETAGSVRLFRAQLDDMAQMIGPRLIAVEPEAGAVETALKKRDALLVARFGAICRADTEGDCEALRLLVEKACVSFLHTRALGVSMVLPPLDALLMRSVYLNQYSKRIGD